MNHYPFSFSTAVQTFTVLIMALGGLPDQPIFAQDRPIKEFFISVQETTSTLLDDPKKEVTVWAYTLKGGKPSVPGPAIRVNKGDIVRVHFTNTHTLPHTMHFHGVHPFNMDGNGQRTLGREQLQMPGESYTYEWVAEDPGFYFYHCHFDTANHIDHGMYGLFIVEDPAWPKVDRELITFWDEWDTDGDGTYDTHTINTRSAPGYVPLTAKVGEHVRIILANIGFEFHTPHLHGQKWVEVNAGTLERPGRDNPNGVVAIGPAEIKVVEFDVKYAGTWLFHCHVVPHVADNGKYPRGMLTLLTVTGDESLPAGKSEQAKGAGMGSPGFTQEPPVTATPDLQASEHPIGSSDKGSDVYAKNCKACHGNFARGGYGPKLQENPVLHDDDKFWNTVLNGRGNMPSWGGRLSVQEIADVQAYLKALKPAPPP